MSPIADDVISAARLSVEHKLSFWDSMMVQMAMREGMWSALELPPHPCHPGIAVGDIRDLLARLRFLKLAKSTGFAYDQQYDSRQTAPPCPT